MKYYLAPLEGITTDVYRRAYHAHFRPMDKYFTPFLVPHTKKGLSAKEIRKFLRRIIRGCILCRRLWRMMRKGSLIQ